MTLQRTDDDVIICRGMRFRDEDDAYDFFRQREIDEAPSSEWPFPQPREP